MRNASILECSHYIIINKGVKFTQFHATKIWTLENAHFIIEENVNTAEIVFFMLCLRLVDYNRNILLSLAPAHSVYQVLHT